MSWADRATTLPPDEDPLGDAVAKALAAIAAAADLDALKLARLEHAGDRSPIALANREIGALPAAARAEAGRRVAEAGSRVRAALDARRWELEAVDRRVAFVRAGNSLGQTWTGWGWIGLTWDGRGWTGTSATSNLVLDPRRLS